MYTNMVQARFSILFFMLTLYILLALGQYVDFSKISSVLYSKIRFRGLCNAICVCCAYELSLKLFQENCNRFLNNSTSKLSYRTGGIFVEEFIFIKFGLFSLHLRFFCQRAHYFTMQKSIEKFYRKCLNKWQTSLFHS